MSKRAHEAGRVEMGVSADPLFLLGVEIRMMIRCAIIKAYEWENTKYKSIYICERRANKKEKGDTNMHQDSLNELEAAMLEKRLKYLRAQGATGKPVSARR